jgi:uncharacterized membrane protein (UPF0182 family)
VRAQQDLPRRPRRGGRRARFWIIIAIVVVIVLIASLRTIATFYTDYLWFGSVHLSGVWRHLLAVKAGLFFGFAAVFFVLLWVNLAVVDRLGPSELALGPGDELVRRYQQRIVPHAVLVRTLVSLAIALIAASGTISQWRNYLLFVNGSAFDASDPQFHKNVGFFVFRLPFLSFIVSWTFVSLVVIAIFTVIAHYLNGGIRVQSGAPTVAPQVKVHVSVLLACMAVVKELGYILARYNLDLSQNGYVQGAGYTDVHARMPALTLLMWISLLAAVILLVNIRRRGWALPALSVGLCAFVALVVGTIYPAIVQAVKVDPAKNVLEKPYIARNIQATRVAMGITDVRSHAFAADQSLTSSGLVANSQSLNDVRLWDPELTGDTYLKLQAIRTYFNFETLAVDRYPINGQLTPVVVGVRQVNTADLPAQGWVNTHLQYTHGYGMIVSPSNQVTSSGQPNFAIGNVPPQSAPGLPTLGQPSVYYGLNNSGNQASYVIANTRQKEIDYQLPNGANQETNYTGTGGVQLTSFIRRLSFAVRFGDFNMLISDLMTRRSRVLFVTDVRAAVQKAAPFLNLDADPYPVLEDGHIDWVLDAYTTTDHYPYAQIADTSSLPSNSGLQQNFNYVRNSVKVIVDAYSGAMTFYDMSSITGHRDPILQAWERAFPGMFTPASRMRPDLRTHLRYPEDIFTVQATAYGHYHITDPLAFFNAGDAWNLSQNPGAGPPQQALATTFTTNAQGQAVTGQVTRMAPLYQVLKIPGQAGVAYNLMDAFVPVSGGDQIQTLSAFMVAGSDGSQYGSLNVYVTPRGTPVDGPALIDARIQSVPEISQDNTLFNTNGSSVILGNVLMVPVNSSMLYFRPYYVQSSRNALPVLKFVIAVYSGTSGNTQVAIGSTLEQALEKVFQSAVPIGGQAAPPTPGQAPSVLSLQVQSLINQENSLSQSIQNDLRSGNLGQYQSDVNSLLSIVQRIAQLTGGSSSSSGSSTSTTTTTVPSGVALRAPNHSPP